MSRPRFSASLSAVSASSPTSSRASARSFVPVRAITVSACCVSRRRSADQILGQELVEVARQRLRREVRSARSCGQADHHGPALRDLERRRSRRVWRRRFEDLPRLVLGHRQLGSADLDCLAVDRQARAEPGRARSRGDHERRRQQRHQLSDERLCCVGAAELVVVVDRDDESPRPRLAASERALAPARPGAAGPRRATSSGRSSPSCRRRSPRRSRRRGRWPARPRRPRRSTRGTRRPAAGTRPATAGRASSFRSPPGPRAGSTEPQNRPGAWSASGA